MAQRSAPPLRGQGTASLVRTRDRNSWGRRYRPGYAPRRSCRSRGPKRRHRPKGMSERFMRLPPGLEELLPVEEDVPNAPMQPRIIRAAPENRLRPAYTRAVHLTQAHKRHMRYTQSWLLATAKPGLLSGRRRGYPRPPPTPPDVRSRITAVGDNDGIQAEARTVATMEMRPIRSKAELDRRRSCVRTRHSTTGRARCRRSTTLSAS